MRLNVLLGISAIYMALLGLGFLFVPATMQFGALDAGASAALLASLRVGASTFLGIAVLNWMARNAEASKTRDAIVLANTVGFGLATILGVIAVVSGAPTTGLVPALINLVFTVAFFWAGMASMSTRTS